MSTMRVFERGALLGFQSSDDIANKSKQSVFFAEYISKLSTISLAELPAHLNSLSKRWPYPRGDLYHWISALDRFDAILENFNSKYGLDVGIQKQPFGVSELLEGSPGFDETKLSELHYGPDGDRELIQSILSFTKLLLEKCGNRNLYNSSERLNDLNSTSLPLVHSALRLGLRLAQRHREKDRSRGQPLPIYAIQTEKLGKLANPTFHCTESVAKTDQQPLSPVKAGKSREKATPSSRARQTTLATDPDDFRALLRSTGSTAGKNARKASFTEKDWQAWVNLRMTLKPSAPPAASEGTTPAIICDPTASFRRESSSLGPRGRNPSWSQDLNGTTSSSNAAQESKPGTTTTLTRSYRDLFDRQIHDILQELSQEVPQAQQYELLSGLRCAYGLLSPDSRKLLLEIRLLAIANLACVLDEIRFTFIVFTTVDDAMPRTKLLQQTVGLLRSGPKEQSQSPLSTQIAAIELLGALAKQKLTANEVSSILGVALSHGSLLALTQKCVADLEHDGDATDTEEGDEWRELVFGVLRITTESTVHFSRSNSDTFASSAIISAYVDGLKVHSEKALRVQLKILEFFKTFHHHIKDGLSTLSTNKAFDAACDSFGYFVKNAVEVTKAGHGFDNAFRTPSTDYKIPYLQQLAIRSILDLINDVSGHPGPHADRVLRELIDSQALLGAFRTILENGNTFGAHTWTEVVKCVSGFLHHEPTSYTIISEAGLSRTLLESVTLKKIPSSQPAALQMDTEDEDEEEVQSTAAVASETPTTDRSPSTTPRRVSALPQGNPQGIIPSIEAMQYLAQAFGAICLTNAGFNFFKSSGALQKYFEIFESPQHVKAMKEAHLVNVIGSTFDELIRHHPSLKPMVISAVITMVARVRNICRQKAWQMGAGPKLWDTKVDSGNQIYGGLSSLQYELNTDSINATHESERRLELPDGTILVDSPVNPSDHDGPVVADMDEDEHELDVTNYLLPVLNFLGPFFETQQPCASFMEGGGTHFVLDLITLPSLPADRRTFAANNVMYELSNVVHSMAETKAHIVLPVLLSRALSACKELQEFVDKQPKGTAGFFQDLVTTDLDVADAMEMDEKPPEANCEDSVKIVRSMTALYSLILVISEVFQGSIYTTRTSQSSPFAWVNLADMFAELCEKLGHISAACLREDLALLLQVSSGWASAAASEDLMTSDDDINGILHYTKVVENSPVADVSQDGLEVGARVHSNGTDATVKASTGLSSSEQQSPAFRNLQTLRYLLRGVASSSNALFTYLSLSFSNKRKDGYQKQSVKSVGRAIAGALISQLQPYFFEDPALFPNERSYAEFHYSYVTLVLREVRQTLTPDQSAAQQSDQCMIFPTVAFKELGGFELLTKIGKEFFDELKMCKTSPDPRELKATFFANAGLKITLDILDKLTAAKNVVESTQAVNFKNLDPNKNLDPKKAFYFSPSQLLLELRMLALPLVRTIWDSEYVYQASHDVVSSSISIFKNVLHGDHEQEAYKDTASAPRLASDPRFYTTPEAARLASLRARGIQDDELAREALFRCWNRESDAYDYARDFARQTTRPRCPVPLSEVDSAASAEAPVSIPDLISAVDQTSTLVPVFDDEGMEDSDEDDDEDEHAGDSDSDIPPPHMNITSILSNDSGDASQSRTEQASTTVDDASQLTKASAIFTIQSIDAERDSIRQELVERCLNILGSQPDITFELSELISFGAKKLSDEAANSYRQDSSHLAIQCLLSLQEDEITESQGKKIAATAHLVALLLQEKEFYDKSQSLLTEVFESLTDFIKVPTPTAGKSAPEAMPWIGYILLVVEKMLSSDAEPPTVTWRMPDGLVESPTPQVHLHELVSHEDKRGLLNSILAILPAVGKDASLALSLTRVLVILTRSREFATLLAEKRNLHKLSIMVKQLSNFDDRLQSAIMIVLRHIVEDEETVRQIMRSEIVAYFTGRSSRQIDPTIYSRDLHGLVLRDSKIFLEVTKEKVKIHHFDASLRQQQLMLKPSATEEKDNGPMEQGKDSSAPEHESAAQLNESVEVAAIIQDPEKAPEPKPPVVERPDGLIHFLLSELLNLKDVEEPPPKDKPVLEASTSTADATPSTSNAGTQTPAPTAAQASTAGKQAEKEFKPEDHPFYSYRIFILEALTELLYSYNRTKVEFINFSRKADPLAATPSKPRSGVLNYLLNVLITGVPLDGDSSIATRKAMTTSEWAMYVIIALCSKTGEMGLSPTLQRYSTHSLIDDKDDEPHLAFVRRFVLEHAMRAFKDATASSDPPATKYSHMIGLSELFFKLMAKPTGQETFPPNHNSSYKVLSKMMFEKNLISVLTSALAEIDLTFAGSKRTIKMLLRPLHELTNTAEHLSLSSASPISSALGATEEDIISSASSSVSEMDEEDGREATPDFFRNSTLGMMEPHRQDHSPSESDENDEDEEGEEEIYDDGYEDEEMYDDMAGGPNDGEVVSDEELDEHMHAGPIEGLPGDVPMNIDLVMDDGGDMDVDSEEDDDEDDEDDEDDDGDSDDDDEEDDDDGSSFMIEGGDAIINGEINGDNENDSLHGDDVDEWMDEEDGEEEEFEDGDPAEGIAEALQVNDDGQAQLDNLLRVIQPPRNEFLDLMNNEAVGNGRNPELPIGAIAVNDEVINEEEDEDDDEEMEDHADIVYNEFNQFLGDDDELIEHDDPWAWDEPPPWARRHRHHRAGNLPGFLSRHMRPGTDIHHLMTRPHRHHNPQQQRAGAQDGTNPLLQRQDPHTVPPRGGPGIIGSSPWDAPPFAIGGIPTGTQIPRNFGGTAATGGNFILDADGGGHGGMLDHLVQMISNRALPPGGRLEISLDPTIPPEQFREALLGASMPHIHHHPHHRMSRENGFTAVSFVPGMTQDRWQQEAQLLFVHQWLVVIQRVVQPILAALVPEAIVEEKAALERREAERKREQEERAERERREAEEAAEAERKRQEEADRAAAAAAEQARIEAEEAVARAAAVEAEDPSKQETAGPSAEPMEGVVSAGEVVDEAAPSGDATTGEVPANRIFTTIRGQQLDITGLSIDAEYLEALPEELREEVIMQQYTAQREQAQEQQGGGGNANDAIDPDFLDALPEDLREEVRQAEAHAARRRERDAARREAAQAGGPAQAEDMDPDSFIATLPPDLRRQILAEQTPELLAQLDPQYAAEGRAHARQIYRYQAGGAGIDPRGERPGREANQRDAKRKIVQMIDKAGVATLLRLMFMPQQGSMKLNLQGILRSVCGNTQTRYEVISTLLLILKEGSADVTAVERSLANLSLRAKASGPQKTPQPLKRTLSIPPRSGISEEITPLMIIQQCLDSLRYLSRHDNHVKSFFLREWDTSASKSKMSKKGKGKENKATKFPLNDLISLLDRKLIMDSSTCLQSCAEFLAAVVSPLVILSKEQERLQKQAQEAAEAASSTEAQEGSASQTVQPSVESTTTTDELAALATTEDTSMAGTEASTAPAVPATGFTSGELITESASKANTEEDKTKRLFPPPVVPDQNLKLVANILMAPECNQPTYQAAIESIRSLSYLPGASKVFREELTSHARLLAKSILPDLEELLPLMKDASSGTDLQTVAASRFAPGSGQTKLLRVMKALDFLYDPEQADNQAQGDASIESNNVLKSSYPSLQLGPVWNKLSECLEAVGEKDNILSFAQILLPLIESLMVVCKNTSLKDAPVVRQFREQSVTSPTPELSDDDLEDLFFNFTTEHRKILNEIVRSNPKLMQGNGSFALLVKNPKVLEFDNKRNYFAKQTQSRQHRQRHPQPPLQLQVRRSEVFLDSFKSLYFKTAEEMKYGKLSVRFHNEEGVDAGGVSREWWSTLARGMFDPNYALWQPVASDKTTFHPNALSSVNEEHLMFFKFIGRIIGKAVHEGRVLDCHFSRAVYKKLLGRPISIKDMESLDIDYYKSLLWILENDITDIISEDFSVVTEVFGEEKVIDLIPDGRNIPVTEDNKADYVQKLVEHRLIGSVKDQLDNFVLGFHDIVPADLVSIFNESELELLISGLPEINVDDWKANTEYHSYSASSQQIQWFWRAVKSFTEPERAALLQFITGTSKVPLNGFKELEGMHGITKCSIHRDPSKERLPSSHTCFNRELLLSQFLGI
jgi:E3 ubiquitin-protein ligase HUWE1